MRIIQGSNIGIEATSRSAVLPFFWLGIHDGTSAIYQDGFREGICPIETPRYH